MFFRLKSLLVILAFIFFFFPSFVHAEASKKIGELCDTGECISGDCEDGVCDCNDSETASPDCAQNYNIGTAADWKCVDESDDPLKRGLDFCVKKTYTGGNTYPETDTDEVEYPLDHKLVIGEKCGETDQDEQCASNDCEDSGEDDPWPGEEKFDEYCVCTSPKDCFDAYGTGGNEQDWECIDGGSNFKNLHYCKQKSTGTDFDPTLKAGSGLVGAILDPEGFLAQFGANIDDSLKKPNPKIKIPGLIFSEIDIQTMLTEEDGQAYLNIPYIGEFITALYRYGIVAAGIMTTVLIIQAGFQWILSGGGEGRQQALKKIAGAGTGLILAIGSYLILYGLNPNLVRFKALKILYIPQNIAPDYVERPEGDFTIGLTTGSTYAGGNGSLPTSGRSACLLKTFAPSLQIGQQLAGDKVKEIKFLGMNKPVEMNILIIEQMQKTEREVLASTDPEVKEFIQWMRDVEARGPTMTGRPSPGSVFTTDTRALRRPSDTHAMGIAFDIMTVSNWDAYIPGRIAPRDKWRTTETMCNSYRNGLKVIRGKYPLLAQRMDKILNKDEKGTCEDLHGETVPLTSIPMGFVKILENNGFYWAGWGWTRKNQGIVRMDPMHFEYVGPCK
ncbi:MAG: hypothetical protein WCW16_05030 [Candidatus Magasanikbacteria bacterium]